MNSNHLQELIMIPVILGIIGGTIVLFTRTILDHGLKRRMVEKGFVNEDTQAIFKNSNEVDGKYSSLKWGLIIFFAGLSLVIMEFLDVTPESPLPYGLFALSVSLGFLIYFFIVKKESQNNK